MSQLDWTKKLLSNCKSKFREVKTVRGNRDENENNNGRLIVAMNSFNLFSKIRLLQSL